MKCPLILMQNTPYSNGHQAVSQFDRQSLPLDKKYKAKNKKSGPIRPEAQFPREHKKNSSHIHKPGQCIYLTLYSF